MSLSQSWLIGCAADCDIVIEAATVSAHHCRLIHTDERYVLEDLNSTNGTFVNNVRIRGPVEVRPTDSIRLGQRVIVPWPAGAQAVRERLEPQICAARDPSGAFAPTRTGLVFGRDASCDHVIRDHAASRRHARIWAANNQLFVEDLNSLNGTFLNGRAVKRATRMRPGDVVSIANQDFELLSDGRLRPENGRGNITVEARKVGVMVADRRLLRDVSLTALPGDFVGVMGPSGAGKTTLLSVMNGYTTPTVGAVFFNGNELHSCYARFASRIGYLPQDDIIHRELTVEEAVYFAARLRLPTDFSEEDIEARVADVLDQLSLRGAAKTVIGSAEKKGISGGERKRVSLAVELLTDPSVLFLDEPTSGLSFEDALSVMKLLRAMADAGKTIFLTIHQPSLELFRLLDNLAVVAKDAASTGPGQLVYYGPAWPDAVRFFNPDELGMHGDSPDAVLSGLKNRPVKDWRQRFCQSPQHQAYVAARTTGRVDDDSAVERSAGNAHAMPVLGEGLARWRTLTRRCLKIKTRDRWNSLILLAQAPIVAVLVVLLFGNDVRRDFTDETWVAGTSSTATVIFLNGLAALWFGSSNAVREIVGEWAVFRRERMVCLALPPYVFSKIASMACLCVLQCFVLTAIVHAGCGLRANWMQLFLMLLVLSLIGTGVGLLVSALAPSSEAAIGLLPIILLAMVVLSGAMQPVHKMSRIVQMMAFAAPSRWGFEGMLLLESRNRPLGPSPFSTLQTTDRRDEAPNEGSGRPDVAHAHFPMSERFGVGSCNVILGAMFVSLVVLIHVVLRARDIH